MSSLVSLKVLNHLSIHLFFIFLFSLPFIFVYYNNNNNGSHYYFINHYLVEILLLCFNSSAPIHLLGTLPRKLHVERYLKVEEGNNFNKSDDIIRCTTHRALSSTRMICKSGKIEVDMYKYVTISSFPFLICFLFLLSSLALPFHFVFCSFLLQVIEDEVEGCIDPNTKGDAGGAAIANERCVALANQGATSDGGGGRSRSANGGGGGGGQGSGNFGSTGGGTSSYFLYTESSL